MAHDTKSLAFLLKSLVRRPRTIAAYRRFMKNQHLSPDELFALNWSKRKRLLHHTYENVPFYRARFKDHGIRPSDIRTPDDFTKLPFLTRQDIRENIESLISKGTAPKRLRVSTTGGSTGVPLRVYHDAGFPQDALGWRMMNWWGIRTGTDEAVVWRFIPGINYHRGWYARAIRGWPTKRIYIDASSMSNLDIAGFIREYNRLRPPLLWGYTGGVDHIASFVEENHLQVHSPKAILLTSSPISTVQRAHIESVFRAPVYDQYGSGEVFWMASQCREKGALHIYADSRHIEFVDEQGRTCPIGTPGEIAVTDLDNYAFPLIRYLNGDRGRAIAGHCPCGINLPLMDAVKGRVSDALKTPDGTFLVGDFATTIFDEFPEAVRQFQIYQKADYSIDLLVVENRDYDGYSQKIDTVRRTLIQKTKGQVKVTVIPVDNIPSDGGKTRYVISEIN